MAVSALGALGLWAACGEPSPPGTASVDAGLSDALPGDGGPDGGEVGGGCPRLFDQDRLPAWSVTISATEWAALEDEFYNVVEREAAGLDKNPWHPVESIAYDDGSGPVAVPKVMIRLKGQSSWLQTIELDDNPKMQFVIAFNEIDPGGRFEGVRKVELDMPRDDWSFLRQRLALWTMRHVGQDAQCANSATLTINGQYYGLYTHLERIDKELLQRIYGKAGGVDDGDLWKDGQQLRTNEATSGRERLDALWTATSAAELGALADLEEAVHEWASEAILPDGDGYQMGLDNYFLYDHPTRGFLWIPSDLDEVFNFYPDDLDLAFPASPYRDYYVWLPYATALSDPHWMGRYVAALAELRSAYDPAAQIDRLETWAAQVADAAAADPHRSFSVDEHREDIRDIEAYLPQRADFIDAWLACRESGEGPDADGDGAAFCFDCDEADPEVHPGQAEACNGIDDDCDGFLDEGCE